MRNKKTEKTNKTKLAIVFHIFSVIVITMLLASGMIFSWFSHRRTAVVVAEISNPTALVISAANKEDVK